MNVHFTFGSLSIETQCGYHPQTDGSSECTNKTINQAIHFHVERNQKGWVRTLPRIFFCIMNTVNASMNYSGFQLHLGCSPQIIPPIVPSHLSPELQSVGPAAEAMIAQLQNNIADAEGNLLLTKVTQAHHAKTSCADEVIYNIGDKVMLSTFHQWCEYKWKGEKRVTKFLPQVDGPYMVIKANTESSSYTLNNDNSDMPRTQQRSKYKSYGALRGCDLGARDCLQVCCGK